MTLTCGRGRAVSLAAMIACSIALATLLNEVYPYRFNPAWIALLTAAVMLSYPLAWLSLARSTTGVLTYDGTDWRLQQAGSTSALGVTLLPAAWRWRWFCVLRFNTGRARPNRSLIVCAANNHPGDYRRLYTWLRLNNHHD